MAPAIQQWQMPLVQEDGYHSTSASTRQKDVVRRIVSKSKMDNGIECSLGSDSSSSQSTPVRLRRSRQKRQGERTQHYSPLYQLPLNGCRSINAAVWALLLLCIVAYQGIGSSSLPHPDATWPGAGTSQLGDGAKIVLTGSTPNSTILSSRNLREAGDLGEDEQDDDDNVIHIVHSRFMQHQPHLVHLGLARLELMKEFTLRSLQLQTSQNFLWIIRTDPALNASLKEPLLETLQNNYGEGNYLVIATNENPNIQIDEILNVDPQMVWSGDLEWAKKYLSKAKSPTTTITTTEHSGSSDKSSTEQSRPIILESRLDADDALHSDFMKEIQDHATEELSTVDDESIWKIWCASRHLEWQYHSASSKVNDTAGVLLSLKDNACVSAGLTLGYAGRVHVHEIPPMKHQELVQSVRSCKKRHSSKYCLDFINLFPTALRARTPTSAGMLNVLLGKQGKIDRNYVKGAKKQEAIQDKIWELTTPRFGFSLDHAVRLRQYLKDNMLAIAKDNLEGQCSSGHSCKESSKLLLQSIIDDPDSVGR